MSKQKKRAGAQFRFFGVGKVLPYLKPFRKSLLLIVIFGLLAGAADVVLPLFQQYALDHFVRGGSMSTVGVFVLLYLFVILFSGATNYISTVRATKTEVNINRVLRNRAFAHLQTLSFSFFNQNSVGYLHSRVMSDTSRVGELMTWTLLDGTNQIIYLIGAITVMLLMNARLAAYVLLILPVLAVLFSLFQTKLLRVDREKREINSEITGSFNEGVTGAKTIKTLAIEEKMDRRFAAKTESMRQKSVRSARLHGMFSATVTLATSVAFAVVLWKGGYIAKEQIGMFSAFIAYAQGIMEPMRWLIDVISSLITTQVNIERYTALLAEEPDVKDLPGVAERYGDSLCPKRENFEEFHGDIEFCDVSFRYPDGEETVLEHFSLKVPFGTHLAIVGETGAGKSTLVNLVCRFFEPTEGKILVDGRDARERSQLWLRSSIGYVLQTPHLFSGTVRENLLMGKPDATNEELFEALQAVCAEEVVSRLAHGLDTDVGENGDLLSTGEKQLLSFARALLPNPKILILDEATASVDTVTEQKLQAAMERASADRTTIAIAHRLSTVKNADMILAVKNGKIVERGTHRELMAQRGYYYELYSRQFEEQATRKILH